MQQMAEPKDNSNIIRKGEDFKNLLNVLSLLVVGYIPILILWETDEHLLQVRSSKVLFSLLLQQELSALKDF